jgi:hypothetical protein
MLMNFRQAMLVSLIVVGVGSFPAVANACDDDDDCCRSSCVSHCGGYGGGCGGWGGHSGGCGSYGGGCGTGGCAYYGGGYGHYAYGGGGYGSYYARTGYAPVYASPVAPVRYVTWRQR